MPFYFWRRLSNIVWSHSFHESLAFKGVVQIIDSIVSEHRETFPSTELPSIFEISEERSNAMGGSFLAMINLCRANLSKSNASSEKLGQAISSWQPLSPSSPSPMEYLVACSLFNPTQLASIKEPASSTVETITLGGFLFSRQRRHEEAADILRRITKDIILKYGAASEQFGLAVAELAKCYNILRQEELSEKCVKKALDLRRNSDLSGRQDQMCLKMALADSLIGRARYNEADPILKEIIDSPAASTPFRMMGILRLAKARRRMCEEATEVFEPNSPLWTGCCLLNQVPDVQRREYLEEVACNLSALLRTTSDDLERPKKLIEAINTVLIHLGSLADTPSWALFMHASKQMMNQVTKKATVEPSANPETHGTRSRPHREHGDISDEEGPWARRIVLSFGMSAEGSIILLVRNPDITVFFRCWRSALSFQSSHLEGYHDPHPGA